MCGWVGQGSKAEGSLLPFGQTLNPVSLPVDGCSSKNFNIMKKFFLFFSQFRKSSSFLLFVTHRVKYFKLLFLIIWMIRAYK